MYYFSFGFKKENEKYNNDTTLTEEKELKKFWKIFCFNSAMICAFILMFSHRFLGLSPGSDSALKVVGYFVAVPLMLLLLVKVNTVIIAGTKKQKGIKFVSADEIATPKDCIKALEGYTYKKDFEKPIRIMTDQIRRLTPKQESLEAVLESSFDKGEMTYVKFKGTLDDVIKLFYDNTKMAIKRIGVFDENEYRRIINNNLNIPEESRKQKLAIYSEHIQFVYSIVNRNEYIITLVDNLLLEISKLEDLNSQSAENINILNDMRALIDNTKYYA
jgi:hypothetical protein